MAKVIKKKIKIPVGTQDKDLAAMFNQMLGTGSINIEIAWPRYKRIRDLVDNLIKVFEVFHKSPFMMKTPEFDPQRREIMAFCEASRAAWQKLFSVDLSDFEWKLSLVEDSQREAFAQVYADAKKSDLVNTFIVLCDRLATYKRYISDQNKLNGVFITAMAGVEFTPFPFTRLNIKYIFGLPDLPDVTRQFFLLVLSKSFELSYKLWQEVTSPDVDVDEFVRVMMANIDEIQKRPELSRCKKAFSKVKDSVILLKQRFNNYYRDFIETKNSTIMMENFILDVSKTTEADAETTRQFRQIIAFYRKVAQEQNLNPKVKVLFDKVNASMKELERGTENLVNIRDDDEPDDSDDDSDDVEVEIEVDPEEEALRRAQLANANKSVDELVAEIEGTKKH